MSLDDQIRTSTNVKMTVRELYIMVYVEKLSDSRIGERMGLSAKTIRNYRRKCQFDTTFKTGIMDLPLAEVKEMIRRGKTDEEIVKRFNTTMTAFTSFKRRFGLNSNMSWPPDRRDLLDLCLSEHYPQEIAMLYGVGEDKILSTLESMSISPFRGTKSANILREADPIEIEIEPTLEEHAAAVLGSRFSYNKKFGFMVDGIPISMQNLMRKTGYKVNLIGR